MGQGGWRDSSSALALPIRRGAPGEESEAGKTWLEENRRMNVVQGLIDLVDGILQAAWGMGGSSTLGEVSTARSRDAMSSNMDWKPNLCILCGSI